MQAFASTPHLGRAPGDPAPFLVVFEEDGAVAAAVGRTAVYEAGTAAAQRQAAAFESFIAAAGLADKVRLIGPPTAFGTLAVLTDADTAARIAAAPGVRHVIPD